MPVRRPLLLTLMALATVASTTVALLALGPSTEPAPEAGAAGATVDAGPGGPRGDRSPHDAAEPGEATQQGAPGSEVDGAGRPLGGRGPHPAGSPTDDWGGGGATSGASVPGRAVQRRRSDRPPPSPAPGPGLGGDEGADVDAASAEGFRDGAAAQRADWLEQRMHDFVEIVVPEGQGEGLSRSCAANGRTCTFEGPATDDFAVRWVQALSYGDMGEDTLQGTQLRDFEFFETDQGLTFSITAKYPDDG